MLYYCLYSILLYCTTFYVVAIDIVQLYVDVVNSNLICSKWHLRNNYYGPLCLFVYHRYRIFENDWNNIK